MLHKRYTHRNDIHNCCRSLLLMRQTCKPAATETLNKTLEPLRNARYADNTAIGLRQQSGRNNTEASYQWFLRSTQLLVYSPILAMYTDTRIEHMEEPKVFIYTDHGQQRKDSVCKTPSGLVHYSFTYN